jgi:hypothetical protein
MSEDEIAKLELRLREQARSFCMAHQEQVDRANVLRTKLDAAVRNVTEAHQILMNQMLGRDPQRKHLMQAMERLQRIMRDNR